MKLNIKTLAATLAAGLAMVSCNQDFDETDYSPKVSEKAQLGIWTRSYTPTDAMPFTVNILVNEAGDTVCDVTYYDASANMANVYSNGKVSYNKQTGMITADFEEDADGTPARVCLTPSNDKSYMIVNVYNVGSDDNGDEELTSVDNFTAVTSDTISVLGRWQLADGKTVELNLGGKASIVDGEDVLEEGSYTFDGKTGSINIGGQTYAMSFNTAGNGQMTIANAYAPHVTHPLPDDWAEYAIGNYTSFLSSRQSVEVTIYYSASRHYYKMNPYEAFGFAGSTIKFNWSQDDNTLKLKTTKGISTGYNYTYNGTNYGVMTLDLATSDEISSFNSQYPDYAVKATKVEDGEFTFCWNVYSTVTNFGLYNDKYEVTDYVVDSE